MSSEEEATSGDRALPRWLVDGMNLIGSRPDGWWNNRDRAARRLLEELDRYARATGEHVTVVLDSRLPGVPPGAHGAVTVVFASRHGPNAADDEIVRMVQGDPAPGTLRVVTSDRRLSERVRELGARVTGSMTFRRRLDAAVHGAGRDAGR